MFSAIASGFFAYRNAEKTKNGEVGRSAVALGQTAGIFGEISKYNNLVGNTARSAASVFSDLAKQNKAFEYVGKVTKFAINNVNPLICVSGGIKTAMSDDKIKTGITETAALTTMFAAEALVKDNYERISKNVYSKITKTEKLKPILEFLEKHKWTGKAGSVIKALSFVAASMTAYTIGEKIGNNMSEDVKKVINSHKKIDQKA